MTKITLAYELFLRDVPKLHIAQRLGIARATVYRILVRRRLLRPKTKQERQHTRLYTKGYPGEEVQIDTTEPLGKSNGIQISAIDDYSRWGFGQVYQGNTSHNAASFLLQIIWQAPFPITGVRVNNGSEFKGEFQRTCNQLGIRVIRNPVKTPEYNGKVERFHRTIEEECLWRVKADPDNLGEVNYQLSRYLSWYNLPGM